MHATVVTRSCLVKKKRHRPCNYCTAIKSYTCIGIFVHATAAAAWGKGLDVDKPNF